MAQDITVSPGGNGTVIVTENADGEIYMITSKYIQDIVDDRMGDRNFVPADNARVFFAAWNGKSLNPYDYSDFESLLRLLAESKG